MRDDDPDILVIGGGVAGLCCAYYLRLAGARVTLVERGPLGGPQSCSSGNTGLVGTQGAMPLAEPGVLAQSLRFLLSPRSPFSIRLRADPELITWLWRFHRACTPERAQRGYQALLELKRRSLHLLRDLCASGPLAAHFGTGGLIVAFRTQEGFERACAAAPRAAAAGVPLRVLTSGELEALEPGVHFDITGALLNEEGASLRVPEFIGAFGRLLEQMPVQVVADAEVTGFEVTDASISSVRTTRGEFRPGEVVLAAGAWSARCARMLRIRLPLQAAKGYTVTAATPPGAPRLPVLLSEGKVAVAPFGGRLRVGGTLELSGLDVSVSAGRVAGILRTVRDYMPGLAIPDAKVWSGLRACTPDGLPLAGRARSLRNLTLCCGHGHIGLGVAPATGQLIADLLAGRQPGIDLAPMSADRYAGSRA